jgi:hypothetical protein
MKMHGPGNIKLVVGVNEQLELPLLCLDKLQDTGSRENHGSVGLTALRKQQAYDWNT